MNATLKEALTTYLSNKTVGALLLSDTFVYDPSVHETVNDVKPYELAGSRITVTATVTEPNPGEIAIDVPQLSWSSVTGTTKYYALYVDTGNDKTSSIIAVNSFEQRTLAGQALEIVSDEPVIVRIGDLPTSAKPQKQVLFYLEASDKTNTTELLTPEIGSTGTYTGPLSRPYFDETGAYQQTASGELAWTKSPSGRVLPTIYPSYTNSFSNNSDFTTQSVMNGSWGSGVSWNGFILGDYIPDTTTSAHYWQTPISASTGDVICCSYICKPRQGQSNAYSSFWRGGGTDTAEAIKWLTPLDGTSPTLPADTAAFKALMSGSIPLPNGYYYVWYSVYVKNMSDHTYVGMAFNFTDSNDTQYYAGDGSTVYWEFGAFNIFKNIIYPPAPVLTSGSAITVSQDQLTFPFDVPYPEEGMTFALELERAIDGINLPPYDGYGKYYFTVGYNHNQDNPDYSPLGILNGYGGASFRIDLSVQLNSGNDKQIKAGVQYLANTPLIAYDYVNNVTYTGGTPTAAAGDPANPPEILFKVTRYTPIWIKRYVIVKGIVDPAKLINALDVISAGDETILYAQDFAKISDIAPQVVTPQSRVVTPVQVGSIQGPTPTEFAKILHAAGSKVDYYFDLSAYIDPDDGITNATATGANINVDNVTPIGPGVEVWLSGGTAGIDGTVTLTVNTAFGRTHTFTISATVI